MARKLFCNFKSLLPFPPYISARNLGNSSDFPELFYGTKQPSVPTHRRHRLGPYDALSALRNEKDPDKILQMFKEASDHPRFHHHRSAYEIAIRKLTLANRLDAIEEILENEKKQSRSSNEGFMVRIIMLYGKAGMPDQAIRTFRQLTDFNCVPTVKSLNALLSSLVQAKHCERVRDLYSEIINTHDINPNLHTFNILIKALCQMNLSESAYLVLDEMSKNGCTPDIVTFNTLLAGLCNEGKPGEAARVLEKISETGCFPDVSTYNIRILNLCRQGKTSEAERLFDEMRTEGVNPDVLSYNTLVNGFCKGNNLKEAYRVFTDMPSRGCTPSSQTYYTLIYYTCKEEDFDWAFELCNESMSKSWVPNITIMQMLVDGLIKNSKFEEARRIIGEVKNRFPVDSIRPWDNIEKRLFEESNNQKNDRYRSSL